MTNSDNVFGNIVNGLYLFFLNYFKLEFKPIRVLDKISLVSYNPQYFDGVKKVRTLSYIYILQ